MEISVGRLIRNYTMGVFGRFMFDLLWYGPVMTYRGIADSLTLREMWELVLMNSSTFNFLMRFAIQSVGLLVGWGALAVIGNSGHFLDSNPIPKRKWSPEPLEVISRGYNDVLSGLERSGADAEHEFYL